MHEHTMSTSRLPLRPRIRLLCAALAAGGLLADCSSTDDPDAQMDAGDLQADPLARIATGVVTGTDIYVATLYEDDRAMAYFCGGPTTIATHTRWFSGMPAQEGAFDLTHDGWRVEFDASADGATGTLSDPDGEQYTFTTESTEDLSTGGLYMAQLDGCRVGVVVLDDSGLSAIQGSHVCEGAEASAVQVIILSPALSDDGGLEVSVMLPDATQATSLTVLPI